jgi:hypothetical protein
LILSCFIAFSGEVDTGSRQENASKQGLKRRHCRDAIPIPQPNRAFRASASPKDQRTLAI